MSNTEDLDLTTISSRIRKKIEELAQQPEWDVPGRKKNRNRLFKAIAEETSASIRDIPPLEHRLRPNYERNLRRDLNFLELQANWEINCAREFRSSAGLDSHPSNEELPGNHEKIGIIFSKMNIWLWCKERLKLGVLGLQMLEGQAVWHEYAHVTLDCTRKQGLWSTMKRVQEYYGNLTPNLMCL